MKSTPDYTALDAALIEKIREGAHTFSVISGGELLRQADALAEPDRRGDRAGWRVLDRRLQALRKAGKLVYSRADGWCAA